MLCSLSYISFIHLSFIASRRIFLLNFSPHLELYKAGTPTLTNCEWHLVLNTYLRNKLIHNC